MSELDLVYDSANSALSFSKLGVLEEKGTIFVIVDDTDSIATSWCQSCAIRRGNGTGPVGVIHYVHTYKLHTFIIPPTTVAVINNLPDSTYWDIIGINNYVVSQLQYTTVYGLAGNVNCKKGVTTSHSPLSDCQYKQYINATLDYTL